MNQTIVISNQSNQYLGTVYFNQNNNLQVDGAGLSLKNLIQKIIQEQISVMQCQSKKKDNKSLHALYTKKIYPKDGILYLEGIKTVLRSKGLDAYLLEAQRAKLYILAIQSRLPKNMKRIICRNLQDIPKDKITELIKILEEKK